MFTDLAGGRWWLRSRRLRFCFAERWCLRRAEWRSGAPRGGAERAAAAGTGAGLLVGIAIFFVYLIYAFGTGTASLERLGEMALFLFLPLAVLASAGGAAAGAWQDLFAIAGVWVAIKFGPSRTIW